MTEPEPPSPAAMGAPADAPEPVPEAGESRVQTHYEAPDSSMLYCVFTRLIKIDRVFFYLLKVIVTFKATGNAPRLGEKFAKIKCKSSWTLLVRFFGCCRCFFAHVIC